MKRLNPDYIERVKHIVNDSPYFSLISMKMCDIGSGYSVFEIDIENKHLQPFGFVHGGVFSSIIDAAAFWAVYCNIEDQNAGMTTIDLKLNYLAPATSGKLIVKGHQIKLGKTIGYAEAEIRNEQGKILSHGTSTLMVLPGKGLNAKLPFPLKFLD